MAAPLVPGTLGLAPIDSAQLCVTAGKVTVVRTRWLNVNIGGMRAVLADDHSDLAELAFTYNGASTDTAPLANGEVRRQVGIKLRAKDTCNVVYATWHIAPYSGIFVSVKSNPGKSTHVQCGANGYINVRPARSKLVPTIKPGERHTIAAHVVGRSLRVMADGELAWEGALPAEAFAFDGPAGMRTDNADVDFEYRVPLGGKPGATCSGRADRD